MNLKIGDEVAFGHYYQNGDKRKTSVQWVIIDEDEDSFLLISKEVLDYRAFDQFTISKRLITWEESEIRRWLNGSFYNELLNKDEKKLFAFMNTPLRKITPLWFRLLLKSLFLWKRLFLLENTLLRKTIFRF